LAAVPLCIWYTRRYRLNFLRLGDLLAPLLALGHFFGRLGCFAAGCCYGKVTTHPWGVSFPPAAFAYREMVHLGLLSAQAPYTPPLHPTQLYEALAELLIFFIVLWVNHRRRFFGQGLATYLILYPITRLVIEMFRADPGRRFPLALKTPALNQLFGLPVEGPSFLSTSQLLSLVALGIGAGLLGWLRRRRQRL
jgi:phosphatidylglycerol:prolipoprotein diacylglycerol transferase